ncbi:MAG TPA: TrkH family potassium uptake protein [Burkholderiales bacterium]|nr:TrkH family potassium uptake protein [Burkholderiales bacterium]
MAHTLTATEARAVHGVLPVLHALGLVVMLFSATMALPVAVALAYGDAALHADDLSAAITLAAGAALWAATRHARRELQVRDGFLLVSLVWAVLPAFAGLPLMFYLPGLSFTDAYFEAMSGLTTTGATVLSELDRLPPSLNIWRGFLQWLGGMGIIVLAVAILPLLGVGGRQLYRAETPGPMKDTKLTPRITETAKGLWLVYCLITAACILAYWAAGMSPFDAVMHAFSTLSLGGFSSHDASFGYFDSPAIEAVAIVFMLLAGVNFATHFLALRRRGLVPYRRDPEIPWFLALVLASSLLIAAFLWTRGVYPDFLTALRHAAFNTVSIATTAGYASADYGQWPAFAPLLMLLLSCIASSAGSTGGGIKMVRFQLLCLQGLREMVKLLHPQAQLPVKLGGQVVANQIVFAVLAFMSLWGAAVTLMTLLLIASGMDFVSAFTAVIACITNTGPGLNQVGPATTYAALTDFQTWVCSVAMLLGRLELFTVLVLFTPAFWRK